MSNSTRHSRRGTAVLPNQPPNEKLESTFIISSHFAGFIKRSSEAISFSWFLTIRGNCMKGLLRHMGLTPTTYHSAFLLVANLIEIRIRGEDIWVVKNKWKIFLERYDLLGPLGKKNFGYFEFTEGRIIIDRIKETVPGNSSEDEDGRPLQGRDLHLLWIDRYANNRNK